MKNTCSKNKCFSVLFACGELHCIKVFSVFRPSDITCGSLMANKISRQTKFGASPESFSFFAVEFFRFCAILFSEDFVFKKRGAKGA